MRDKCHQIDKQEAHNRAHIQHPAIVIKEIHNEEFSVMVVAMASLLILDIKRNLKQGLLLTAAVDPAVFPVVLDRQAVGHKIMVAEGWTVLLLLDSMSGAV